MADNRAIPAPFAASAASESVADRRAGTIAWPERRRTSRKTFANGAEPVAKGGTDIKAGKWIRC